VISREEKYKAKNLIDVVVYRGSDALYGWVFDGLQAVGLKLGAIALVSLPAAAGWVVLSLLLGRVQGHRAASIDGETAKAKGAKPDDVNIDDVNLGEADIGIVSSPVTGERA
jgi:ATP:ADP antiporter, AAA family